MGLDPRPFDRKPIAVEADPPEQREVLVKPMIAVAGVAGRFLEGLGRDPFHEPEIGIDVIALDLMARSRGAPAEAARERTPWRGRARRIAGGA